MRGLGETLVRRRLLGLGDPGARPRLLAAAAVVVLVPSADRRTGVDSDRVVLVALAAPAATAVAGAGLTQALTLTIH